MEGGLTIASRFHGDKSPKLTCLSDGNQGANVSLLKLVGNYAINNKKSKVAGPGERAVVPKDW